MMLCKKALRNLLENPPVEALKKAVDDCNCSSSGSQSIPKDE
jgi:hypothetical protein